MKVRRKPTQCRFSTLHNISHGKEKNTNVIFNCRLIRTRIEIDNCSALNCKLPIKKLCYVMFDSLPWNLFYKMGQIVNRSV